MHIVIIGGGAAGMATAHYLASTHRVTVLERQSIVGGNIRTVNKNVTSAAIPADVILDSGVIEFHRDHSPGFASLIGELGLHLDPVDGGSTGLYLEDGRCFHMPGAIQKQNASLPAKIFAYSRLIWLLRHLVLVGIRMRRSEARPDDPVSSFLDQDPVSKWIRMLLMYGYSMPYAQIDRFPARIAIRTLKQGFIGTRWIRLRGGVYTYVEEIIERAGSRLSIQTNQTIKRVARRTGGIFIDCSAGLVTADRVVFAVPPDQVLDMLEDPDADERRWFATWQGNHATTVIHTDTSIYSAWGAGVFTEFDLFEKEGGNDAGYNAYLNRLCGLPEDSDEHYFLAYNMDDRIDPRKVLHRQRHYTPCYTAESLRYRDEIRRANGRNATYHAGAYLYNGLHEGAIQSALAIKAHFGLQ